MNSPLHGHATRAGKAPTEKMTKQQIGQDHQRTINSGTERSNVSDSPSPLALIETAHSRFAEPAEKNEIHQTIKPGITNRQRLSCYTSMSVIGGRLVGVAERLRHLVVAQENEGSNPSVHPNSHVRSRPGTAETFINMEPITMEIRHSR
jgi:hypothetical protein